MERYSGIIEGKVDESIAAMTIVPILHFGNLSMCGYPSIYTMSVISVIPCSETYAWIQVQLRRRIAGSIHVLSRIRTHRSSSGNIRASRERLTSKGKLGVCKLPKVVSAFFTGLKSSRENAEKYFRTHDTTMRIGVQIHEEMESKECRRSVSMRNC